MKNNTKQIFSIRKFKVGACSALIGTMLMGVTPVLANETVPANTVPEVPAVVESKPNQDFKAIDHDLSTLTPEQMKQVIKGLPEIKDLDCGDTVHFVFEKEGKVVVTNKVPDKPSTSTKVNEPTPEVKKIADKELPKTGSSVDFKQATLIGFITLGATMFLLYKNKKTAKLMIVMLMLGGSTLSNTVNANSVTHSFNSPYKVMKNDFKEPKLDGYKYVGYWIDDTHCEIPNNYPTVDKPSINFDVPNNYPTVEKPSVNFDVPNDYPTVEKPSINFDVPNDYPTIEKPEGVPPRGNVVVKYVSDENDTEIKELLKLKDNEVTGTNYTAERIPEIDAGDYVYKLVEDKIPANEKGTITDSTTEIVYRYVKVAKKGSVVVEYVKVDTGEKVKEDLLLMDNKPAGTDYTTEKLPKINDLILVESELPSNATGKVEADKTTKVTYKYREKLPGEVYVRFVVKKDNKELMESLMAVDRWEGEDYDVSEHFRYWEIGSLYNNTPINGKYYKIIEYGGAGQTGVIIPGLQYIIVYLEEMPEDFVPPKPVPPVIKKGNVLAKWVIQGTDEVLGEEAFDRDLLVGYDYDYTVVYPEMGTTYTFNNKKYELVELKGAPFKGTVVEGDQYIIYVVKPIPPVPASPQPQPLPEDGQDNSFIS